MAILTTETLTSTIDEIESRNAREMDPIVNHWQEQAAAHLRNYRETLEILKEQSDARTAP